MNVHVHTKPDRRNYDVIIEPGVLDHLDEHVVRATLAHAYAIIADSTIARVYGERVVNAMRKHGARAALFDFQAGEKHKNITTWASLIDRLIESGYGRDSCVIALGGGVVTDLAGFVAATFMRGVPVVHVPTSLLAMIDAAIGGKTGVDTDAGKNLIGAFHQPAAVIIDPHLLRTLPDAELRFGLAEALKHGAIADAEYFSWIAGSVASIFEHKTHTLTSLISRSVELKAHYVSEDVHEQAARAALNFGHTIAHALEQATDYGVAHGDAVAAGMIVEAAAGELAGVTEAGTARKLQAALNAVGLPTRALPAVPADAVLAAARTDKKTRAGVQRYTLLARLGEVVHADGNWTMPLPDDVVSEALRRISLQR